MNWLWIDPFLKFKERLSIKYPGVQRDIGDLSPIIAINIIAARLGFRLIHDHEDVEETLKEFNQFLDKKGTKGD